jgi:hypothetical protein
VLAAALLLGGATAPAMAATSGADPRPSPTSRVLQQTPQQLLEATVTAARAEYAAAITAAKAERDAALVLPRAERDAALKAATTKAERRLAKRAYVRATAPINAQYASARQVARTTRDAAIEAALATFLASTGKPEVAESLRVYRDATTKARDTLALALTSAAETFKTDTADERQVLLADLEQASTTVERNEAWKDFVAATETERVAQGSAIAAARATYHSAMRQARATFKLETGVSVRTLMRRAFNG